jgi:hypothetical protein
MKLKRLETAAIRMRVGWRAKRQGVGCGTKGCGLGVDGTGVSVVI